MKAPTPVRPRRLLQVLLLLAAALLLGACSARLAYSQLDWLVPWYLRDYVSFNAGQRDVLDQRLSQRLDWHCRAHLPQYVELLREARSTLAADEVAVADLEPFVQRGEAWWDELRAALVADAAVLLAGLTNDQVLELAAAFERQDREAREEYLGGSAEQRAKAQIRRMEKRLGNWFGRLTAEQQRQVAAWSVALHPSTEQWLDGRRQWQQRVLHALAVRDQSAQFAPRVAALATPFNADAPAAYQAQLGHNRQLTLRLLADVFNAATPSQRERVRGELGELGAQFEALACAGPQVANAS